METILLGNYKFLSYQNVCIYKMGWHSINTIDRVFNHTSGHQHFDKVCGICISSLKVELWVKLCNTDSILCEYYHIIVHIFLNIAHTQISHTWMLMTYSFQWYTIQHSSYCTDTAPAQFITTHILVTKEFIISWQNDFHSNQNHVTWQFQHCQSTYQIWWNSD